MYCLENELTLLQEKDWSEKEGEMVKSLIENIKYYRKIIPNSLKKDICEALNMCNELKVELDTYREFCKNKGMVYHDKNIVTTLPYEEADDKAPNLDEKVPNLDGKVLDDKVESDCVINDVIIISSSNEENCVNIIVDTSSFFSCE
jgi:hypothetical protein